MTAAAVALADVLRCGDCRRPLALDPADLLVSCANTECFSAGLATPLGQWARTRGLLTGPPAGRPRPVSGRLPVPWTTLVVAGVVVWRALDTERVRRCQAEWLCQVCGEALDASVVVIVDGETVLSASALHPGCADQSLAACPAVSRGARRGVLERRHVAREEIGIPGPESWIPLREAPVPVILPHVWTVKALRTGL